MPGNANPQVISHPFKPLKKIEMEQAKAANQHEDKYRDEQRCGFEALELHTEGLNKKPAQLKAALVEISLEADDLIIIPTATAFALAFAFSALCG
jgi:hypothetical protein